MLTTCNNGFAIIDQAKSSKFTCRPCHFIEKTSPLRFNGATTQKTKGTYGLSHVQIENLKDMTVHSKTNAEFINQRARGAFLAAVCPFNLTFVFSAAVQVTSSSKEDVMDLNEAISHVISTKDQTLSFFPLDMSSIHIAYFVDTSFASNKACSTELSFLISVLDN